MILCYLTFIEMGGKHKLRLSSVKHHARKRKEVKLTKQKLLATAIITLLDATNISSFLITLPLSAFTCGMTRSLFHLHDSLKMCGGISNWQVVEATAERLTLVKIKLIPSPCVAMSVQIYPSFEYCATVDGYKFCLPGENNCSLVFSVDRLISLVTIIGSYHLCKGNDFPEVVSHNKGNF